MLFEDNSNWLEAETAFENETDEKLKLLMGIRQGMWT